MSFRIQITFLKIHLFRNTMYPTLLFSLLHMNIHSITRHMNELEAYMSNLCHNFSIVAVTETWFTDVTADTYSLQGYTHKCNQGNMSVFK